MSPIYFRGFLYFALAALPVWVAYFSDAVKLLLEGKEPLVHYYVWLSLICSSLYQSLLALRAFIDGTVGREKEAAEGDKSDKGKGDHDSV